METKETIEGYHERPLGGNAEGCFPPSDVIRMNFIVLRLDHSPFHRRRAATTSSLVTSGNQNPVLSSLFSLSVRWSSTSSRFAGGRPLRRSCCNCSISGTSRLMYLWREEHRVSNGSTVGQTMLPHQQHTSSPFLEYPRLKQHWTPLECFPGNTQSDPLSASQPKRSRDKVNHRAQIPTV